MQHTILLSHFFQLVAADERISVWHISLCTALLYLCCEKGLENPVAITRKQVMQVSHIHSFATYHKCMKELKEWGYIEYRPSYHPFSGSLVAFKHVENSLR